MDWIKTQSHRMEGYAVLALIIGVLSFSHILGYWPHGVVFETARKPFPAEYPGWLSMVNGETVWRVIFLLSLLAVGVLYYKGRKVGNRPTNAPQSDNLGFSKSDALPEDKVILPKLHYDGVSGEGWFLLGNLGVSWYFQFIDISNSQQDIPMSANNVRAQMTYRHADGETLSVASGLWKTVPKLIEFPDRVHIESGSREHLCLEAQQSAERKTNSPFCVIEDINSASRMKILRAGKWSVSVTLLADNCDPYIGKGGFTISQQNQLAYSDPAFTFENTRQPARPGRK